MAGLMDGGDFDNIGKKASKGGGNGNTVKIAVIAVLFLAAAGLFAYQFGLIGGSSDSKVVERVLPPQSEEEKKAMDNMERRQKRDLEEGKIIEGEA